MIDRTHYAAIAARLDLPTRAFIAGQAVPAQSRAVFETINPANGEVIAAVAHCQIEDVDRAVRAARQVFADGTWSRSTPEHRKVVLLRLAGLIRQHGEELAILESLESGKPIRDTLREITTEVPDIIQWYAELADKTYGAVAPTGEDACALIVGEPVGVVGAVLPWNFPLVMAAWKLGPALASGCSVLVKPAEQTSMTALALAALAAEAGLPPGVLNVLPGLGETTGRMIGLHPEVDVVSFTGSTEVGRCFLRYAADSNLKSIGLEMGGKSPLIVLDDAEISDALIEHATMAAFWNGGQNCSANMRQIVARAKEEEYIARVAERAASLVVGDPLDPATEIGPLISAGHRRRVAAYIEGGRAAGAHIVLDQPVDLASRPGWYLAPTVMSKLRPDMAVAREEIFGPVLGVMAVDDVASALALADDTAYGLHATVFTRDIDRALFMARRLACGTVAINGFTEGDIKTPFGGYRRSGSLARDKGREALAQYTQKKTIWIASSASV